MIDSQKAKRKFKEWLKRYLAAELLGGVIALSFAYAAFSHAHSYALAAGVGLVGEGIGFYGYFVVMELSVTNRAYKDFRLVRRLAAIISKSSTNLIIEFAPAEIIDNLFIRPLLMYYLPQKVKPYAVGFAAAELLADLLFYSFAIVGYEIKKKMTAK